MHRQRTGTASSPSTFPFPCIFAPHWKIHAKAPGPWEQDRHITFFTGLEHQEPGEEREEDTAPGRLLASSSECTPPHQQSLIIAESCSGRGKQEQEGVNTLTAGVLRIAVCFFKAVLSFAFHSPAESTFCWVENKAGMVTGQYWMQNHADRRQDNMLLCHIIAYPEYSRKVKYLVLEANGPDSLKG